MSAVNSRKPTKLAPRQRDIYENGKVFSIEGKLLFRCSKKRLDWYHSRGLAKYVDANSIQLNFETKGSGRAEDKFYLEDQPNRCVGCGRHDQLTLHHIVPEMYRKYMPECIKSRSSFDLLPVCTACHDGYERFSIQYKKALVENHSAPLEGTGWILHPEHRSVSRAASALIKNRTKIPAGRVEELESIVLNWWRQSHPESVALDNDILNQAVELPDREKSQHFKEHGEIVVEQLMKHAMVTEEGHERWLDLEAFIISWRKHFLQCVQPRYLSPNWSVEQSVYNR
ncbi:hypothetical protein K493DRAFT_318784 [Basidiobolus meristosporus CBS 931.73]|uniref:HNH domain-containing protein n=1 Tax=Basidiobolus meristosporus CBS 931.73 TaxID=1314790 RepID=A0A1Y1XUZ9_9FUNG|nr:hypothetical protein K493DRAFT_318784 [Basidiobolus meristosporus CBS 931.73]|eukprot:ORX89316.1 hypothetical protein K493DRAFT_318784 [Basidiobolus meristosporus CBS 931.73]